MYVTKKEMRRWKIVAVIATGIAIGTIIGVILVLWMIWAFIDGFS